ncbi:type II secretion system F family protein [Nicoliella spurrieriana]|uniref:Type II secretion system F family protein n=1 Tax=Nicoliella spurrieriana TaxID=2925830 RepID=A0A976RRX3_9LACO|nr:competence type IV pilus assembly protein ComGB [Nicoliella spurrieriana]UQS86772.1 type II secretion system F family protein [Nicoliella spurrieriana]
MGKGLSIKKQLRFLESFNSLLQNGFSIGESMKLITELYESDPFTDQMLTQLNNGETFATGMRNYFPDDIVNQIQIAERHGQLVDTMHEVQLFIAERNKQQNKLKALLMYPFFLIGLLLIIILGIKFFVTPQLTMISERAVPSGGHHFWWWFLLSGLLLIVGLLSLWIFQKTPIQRVEIFAKLPIIGVLIKAYYAYFFASNVSLLLASGMEAKSIAKLMQQFSARSIFYEIGSELEATLQAGGRISKIIERHSFLPNEAGLFFDRGDQVQVVAKKLSVYAKLSFAKLWNQSQRLIAIIQPIIFIVIGSAIVVTYLNMLLPMYDTLSEVYK